MNADDNGSNGVIWIMLSMLGFAVAIVSLVVLFYALQIWLACQVMLRLLEGQFIRAAAWGIVLAAFVCADLGASESYTEVCVAIVGLALAATAEKFWWRQRQSQAEAEIIEPPPNPTAVILTPAEPAIAHRPHPVLTLEAKRKK